MQGRKDFDAPQLCVAPLIYGMVLAMSSNGILLTVAICAGIVLWAALSVWSRHQALIALRSWADAQNFEVVSAKRRTFAPVWTSGKGYQFFRIVVRDTKGKISSGWARCLDFNSAEPWNIEVAWD